MKRYLTIFAVALTLGGCATVGSIGERVLNLPVGVLTDSIDNPITLRMSYQAQQGLRVVVAGLRTHKRLCEREVLPVSCVVDVVRLQGYVQQARPVIADLRKFVKENDQVNARIAFNTVVRLISNLRQDAARAGVTIAEK